MPCLVLINFMDISLGETEMHLGCMWLVSVGVSRMISRVSFLVQSCNLQIKILPYMQCLDRLFCAISLL